MMNLKINIEQDEELRGYIKALIASQVKSVAREEIRSIVKEVFSNKVAKEMDIDQLFSEEVSLMVKKAIKPTQWNQPDAIKIAIRTAAEKAVNNALKTNNHE